MKNLKLFTLVLGATFLANTAGHAHTTDIPVRCPTIEELNNAKWEQANSLKQWGWGATVSGHSEVVKEWKTTVTSKDKPQIPSTDSPTVNVFSKRIVCNYSSAPKGKGSEAYSLSAKGAYDRSIYSCNVAPGATTVICTLNPTPKPSPITPITPKRH